MAQTQVTKEARLINTHRSHSGSERAHRGNPDRHLRLILKLDALATGAVGLLAVVASSALEKLLGLPLSLLLPVGLFLLTYAVFIWFIGARRNMNRAAAWIAVVVNCVYVAGCVGVVVMRPFSLTPLGVAFVLVQAAAVGLFAVLQTFGLCRSRLVHS